MTIPVTQFGRNPDLDIASMPAELWNVGGIYTQVTAPRIHDIVGDSIEDDSAGDGARTIRVRGLVDWDGAEVEEDIVMDGLTNVPTVNTYEMINSLSCLTFGSERSNVGNITATARVDAAIECQVSPAFGRSLQAVFGFGSPFTFVLNSWYGNFNKSGGQAGKADLELCKIVGPDTASAGLVMLWRIGLHTDGDSYIFHPFDPPIEIPGPGIVLIRVAGVSVNNSDISGGFQGFLR